MKGPGPLNALGSSTNLGAGKGSHIRVADDPFEKKLVLQSTFVALIFGGILCLL